MTRAAALALLFTAAACPLLAQDASPIRNADFEAADAAGLPLGWGFDSPGYAAQVVPGEGVAGGAALLLRREPGATGGLGTVAQSIDATAYRGKRIRLRAHARAFTGGGSWAGMWLREDGPGGTGFFDNMQERPIRSGEWRSYEIVGDIGADADRLTLGLLLTGPGVAWLDDVELVVLGDAPPLQAEPPRALTARGLENVVAFGRLLGYVRYFHPGDAAADANWEWVAIDGIRRVEGAADARALAAALGEIFTPLAPGITLSVGTTAREGDARHGTPAPQQSDRVAAAASDDRAVAWRHHGVGMGSTAPIYTSTRVRLPTTSPLFGDSLPAIGERYVADVGGGVVASIPLTVLVREVSAPEQPAGTTSRPGHPPVPLPTAGAFSATDRATRMGAVVIGWNVFQHFYPYFDVVRVDWPAELRRALTSAATDADPRAFLNTLRLMVAALQDGHGSVLHASDTRTHALPISWADVHGHTVITVAADTTGVRPGDVVIGIDGRLATDVVFEEERLTSSATPQWRRYRALRSLLAGPADSEMVLEVQGTDREHRTVTLRRTVRGGGPVEPRPEPVAEVRPGIYYVDISRVTDQQFRDALPQLEAATGLVFDMRGYPGQVNAAGILSHLLTSPGTSAQWHVPVVTRPDRTDMRFTRIGEWNLQPLLPHLSAPAVFLTDGRAVSYAESIMGIVEHYRLGEIVGQATAGTNGNVNPFSLPGGYRVSWTGMKVLKHDSSLHHGLGIMPTIPTSRSIEGIAAGRDELLERALEVLPARR